MAAVSPASAPTLEKLLVRHIMTDSLVTLREHHSLPLASALMFERGIAHLPILSGEGVLLGLVSQRDVLAAELSYARAMLLADDEREEIDMLVPLGQIVKREVATLSAEMSVRMAAQHLLEHRQGCAPVLDDKRAVIGVVAEDDILSLCLQRLQGHSLSVADLMTRELVTASRDTSVPDALALMSSHDIHHLPVADSKGALLGVVSHRDLQIFERSMVGKLGAIRTLNEFLGRDIWTTTLRAKARDAAQTLRDNRFGCLPVVEDGHLLGIVTQSDLLKAIVELDSEQTRRVPSDVPSNYYVSAPLRWLSPEATLAEALDSFEHFSVSTLLVMHEELTLGILSRSDVLRAMQSSAKSSGKSSGAGARGVLEQRVTEHMSTDLVSVPADQSVGETAALLVSKQIHHVLIVEDDRVVGILGTTDILLAVRDHRLENPLREFMSQLIFTIDVHESLGAALRYLQRAGLTGLIVQDGELPVGVFGQREALRARDQSSDLHIEDLMSPAFLCLSSQTPAFRAAQQAAALGVQQIAVQEDGKTVGLVTTTDFARILARQAPPSYGRASDTDTHQIGATRSKPA